MPHDALNHFELIAIILLLAVGAGAMAALLRQPLIVAFIGVGILAGPVGLGLVGGDDMLPALAEVGIALLLFLVGLRLDLQVIRTMGPVSLATGLGQVAFTSIVGFGLCLLLGIGVVASVYIAVALTFSSTIIIVKLLSDKREIDALHGRIAVGFLIVQDIVVVIAMIVLSAFGAKSGAGDGSEAGAASVAWGMLSILGRGVLLLGGVALMMWLVLPRMVRVMAKHPELLALFGIAWAVAGAAGSEWLGFSKEVGAFLAGVSLASTPFRNALGGRLVSLRDFLLLFFFLVLGAQLDLSQVRASVGPAIVLSAFVLIGNPIIVLVIMGWMGYRRRTSFLAGLTVAQISEFSLILGALGVTLGHIDQGVLGLITLVGIITIGLSTYMILYSHPLYERLSPLLRVFERRSPTRERGAEDAPEVRPDAIVIGLGRYGLNISRELTKRGWAVLGVDYDPVAVRAAKENGLNAEYADAEDPEELSALPLAGASWVVCTAPLAPVAESIVESLREVGYSGRIAAAAHSHAGGRGLERVGVDLVLFPYADGAVRAGERIDEWSRD